MQTVDFYALDRAIQDRFIASSHGREVPSPLLSRRPKPSPALQRLLVLVLVLFLSLVGFAQLGYGRLDHPWGQHPTWAIAVYSGLAGALAAGLFFAWKRWDKDNAVPFLRGVFLYPIGVIDATSSKILVHELTKMKDLRLEGGKLKLAFHSGADFEFALPDPSQGEAIVASLNQCQARITLPPGVQSQRDHILQNPLLDTGFKNPFGPTEQLTPKRLRHPAAWAAVALATGMVLGLSGYFLRNHLSARSLYAQARALDTTAAYLSFVKSGVQRSEVVEILLPRAQLRDAIALKSADAVEKFLDSHPKSKVENEALVALRQLLLAELKAAEAKQTLSALREFRKQDPRRVLVEAERIKAETAVYRSVLSRFQEASTGAADHVDFVARLLEYTRKHGTEVDIRFCRRHGESVNSAESQVKRSTYYMGPAALPKQYFDEAHSLPRESRTATALIERFSSVFPSDVLQFRHTDPLPDSACESPTLERPTLLISYRLEMSGPFNSNKPRGAFCGVSYTFKAAFSIPGDTSPLVIQTSSWNPPNLRKVDEERQGLANLYESLGQEGFTRFLTKYQAALFKAPAK